MTERGEGGKDTSAAGVRSTRELRLQARGSSTSLAGDVATSHYSFARCRNPHASFYPIPRVLASFTEHEMNC